MKIIDTPFFKTTPYFTNPSIFIGNFEPLLFFENFENSDPPLYKGGGFNYDHY